MPLSPYFFPFQISNTYLYTYIDLYSWKVDAILIISGQKFSENKKVKEGRSLGVYVFIFIHDNISCLFLDTAWLKIIVMMKSTFVEKNL